MTTQSAPISLQLHSNPVYLAGARELINAIAKRIGFEDADCSKIALAVDEALCNIIRHGYDRQNDRPIWIQIHPLGQDERGKPNGGIRVIIEDEAKQVDPETMKGRDLEDIKPGGLGVHIIKEIMDSVEYDKRPDVGMRLTMTKKTPADTTPPVVQETRSQHTTNKTS